MNKDAQAILILCSNLCVGDGVNPLAPSEWRRLAKILVDKNITPSALLDMQRDEIISSLNCEEPYADRIIKLVGRSASLFFEVSKYENIGISIVTRADKNYPQRIKKKLGESCPPYFFYAGDLGLLNKRGIGFVGPRNMSDTDAEFEKRLVADAINNRYAIVSGGARGADTISEETAFRNGGKMIEFLADSMVKKMRKSEIIKAVQKNKLLLLSVVNPDAGFNVGNAMNRNKYIFAQADATIAVKSIKKGGTWNGVMENLKHDYCPVYCWNNDLYDDNMALIEAGAIPIDDSWSIKDISPKDKNNKQKTNNNKLKDQIQPSLFS